MVRQMDKVLEVRRPKLVAKAASNVSRATNEVLVQKLFDIDPCVEPKEPVCIDLDLDQIENVEE